MSSIAPKRHLDLDEDQNIVMFKRQRFVAPSTMGDSQETVNGKPSPFSVLCSKMTPEMLNAGIKEQVLALYQRKQLGQMEELDSPSEAGNSSGVSLTQHTVVDSEQPFLNVKQVKLICDRLLAERDRQLRRECDQVLLMKWSEQYEAFVNFTNNQLRRRFEKPIPGHSYFT